MLLYTVEAAVPLLTWLLIWAGTLALRGETSRHRKIATIHALATWVSYVIVIAMVRLGYSMEGKAPEWILDTHLVIIYLIPPTLVALMATGFGGKGSIHKKLALFHTINWAAALVTGAMIFLMARGYL